MNGVRLLVLVLELCFKPFFMKTYVFLLAIPILFLNIKLEAQGTIDYEHKALKKSLFKAGVNELSDIQEIIPFCDDVAITNLDGKYFYIAGNISSNYEYLYVGRVNSCRSGGCSVPFDEYNTENSEYFDYFILFDKVFSVRKVQVFNYQATHGHEITTKGWLKQFIGYNGDEILRPGNNIDAISGATISVNSITNDVSEKTLLLKQCLKNSSLGI